MMSKKNLSFFSLHQCERVVNWVRTLTGVLTKKEMQFFLRFYNSATLVRPVPLHHTNIIKLNWKTMYPCIYVYTQRSTVTNLYCTTFFFFFFACCKLGNVGCCVVAAESLGKGLNFEWLKKMIILFYNSKVDI